MGKGILGKDGRPVNLGKGSPIDIGKPPVDKLVQEAAKRKKDEKAQEEAKKKHERFMNQKVSRKEVMDLVTDLEAEHTAQTRMLFVQVKTLTNLIIDKGLATLDELDELSKSVMESIYGVEEVTKATEEKEKEEEKLSN